MEEAVIHFLDLPEGQDYVWFADCNMVGLARRIQGDEEAICRAMTELQGEWRRGALRSVS